MSSVKDHLLWNTVCMPNLHPELKGMMFKLERWPDFGKVSYNQNFIELCSLLSIQYVSTEELKAFSSADEESINHLLNILKAKGLLDLKEIETNSFNKGYAHKRVSYREKLLHFIKSAYQKMEHTTEKVF